VINNANVTKNALNRSELKVADVAEVCELLPLLLSMRLVDPGLALVLASVDVVTDDGMVVGEAEGLEDEAGDGCCGRVVVVAEPPPPPEPFGTSTAFPLFVNPGVE
jgi:hypothetical protein